MNVLGFDSVRRRRPIRSFLAHSPKNVHLARFLYGSCPRLLGEQCSEAKRQPLGFDCDLKNKNTLINLSLNSYICTILPIYILY